MNYFGPTRRRQFAQGFTLVELLIATALGLLLLAGVTSVFLGSRASFRTQESLGQVQESGRFLNYVMYPYVRLAGYLPSPRDQIDPANHFRGSWQQILGSEGGFFDATDVTGIDTSRMAPGSDALLVTYGGNDTLLRTCRGQQIAANQMAVNVFYLSRATTDPAGTFSLYCATVIDTSGFGTGLQSPNGVVTIPAGNAQPLVFGVQDMQILYGVDTNPADDNPPPPAISGLTPNRYVTADDIDIDSDGVDDWERVISVRIDLTAAGIERTEGGATGTVTTDIADDFVDGAGRVQRQFSTILTIRNRLRS